MSAPGQIKNRHKVEIKAWTKKKAALTKASKKKPEKLQEIEREEAEMMARHEKELSAALGSDSTTTSIVDETKSKDGDDEEFAKRERARRKREKREAQEEKRQEALALGAQRFEEAEKTGARAKEIKKIAAKLATRNLSIKEMPADGSCLFEAVSDQLSFQNHPEAGKNASEVRQIAARFLKAHFEDFGAFFCGETDDMMTLDEFDAYCDKMGNSNEWGGEVEIVAISRALKCSFLIVSAEAPDVVIGDEVRKESSLILTYHKFLLASGEHYNSVEKIS